jgi:PhnB protein
MIRIAPWLSVNRTPDALRYYQTAFGAVERYRLEDESGGMVVAQLSIAGTDIWLQEDPDASPTATDTPPVRMLLIVQDPDAVFAQAVAAGATEIFAMSEEYGWRTGRIVDPFGHHWEICKLLG